MLSTALEQATRNREETCSEFYSLHPTTQMKLQIYVRRKNGDKIAFGYVEKVERVSAYGRAHHRDRRVAPYRAV